MTSQVMTTEQLRTQRKPENIEANFNTYRGFQAMHHMAESLANSTIIPEAFRNTIQVKDGYDPKAKKWNYRNEPNPNGVSNCIIALNMAQRLGADPMMIMQNLYLVDGRPSWSSQFIIAAINSSGRYSPLRFDITGGEEEIEIPYATTEWVYSKATNKKEPVESNLVARVKNYKCVAWVIEKATGERLESTPITMEMAVKEGWYQKNGSKWQSMPEQMLRYRAASFFGRIYAPDLLMGLRTQEEEIEAIIDVTPEPEPQDIPTTLNSIKKQVVKVESSAEELEPQHEEVPPVEAEEKVQKTKTSATSLNIRKDYLVKMNQAESNAELNELREQFIIDDRLTEAHLAYLKDAYAQHKERINPVQSVNQIKSNNLKNGFKTMIVDANTVADLEKLGTQIRDSKPQLSTDDMAEILKDYAARKKFLEDQQDMFADVNESVSYVDAVIARIQSAESQDDINAEYADPAIDELSDKDKQRIDLAAQKREEELQR
ncbi:hypothetical protein B9T31_15925 [Acinetobacter sp. ANC 4558]|uniref:recombinase RecT n=1 Tax=Acinetobacter sp. ANC 4558 TaxID=1977876 RepID=UPI000A334105|nr:recombinase RecT [Acinetobacter sp. ANC 4558]OTG80788.1 hypothetical protein B9T31_15925 [Acinetobacter sp. ANC 4558]